jgi:hypothetical protein
MDGWESTTSEHIVNVLAVAGDKFYFLESFQTGSNRQGATDQAALVQRVIDLFPGIFDAVFSESRTCCSQMREVIAPVNPGMASIMIKHTPPPCSQATLEGLPCQEHYQGRLVRGKVCAQHYRLTFAYQKAADKYNANEIAPRRGPLQVSQRYPQPNATRFRYVRD